MGKLVARKIEERRKMKEYPRVEREGYKSLFGIDHPPNYGLNKRALKKAWEARNFEIDKFWQRSAYLWGFIALIFTGYFIVVTGESSEKAERMYLDLYLILLGLIFSVAWFLVIRGSRQWQENWEKHIDWLEDAITGPLYKTMWYTGKKSYSVSRISSMLAWVVIITWGFLLLQYLYTKRDVFENIFEQIWKCPHTDIFLLHQIVFLLLPLIGTGICIAVMIIRGQSFGGEFIVDLKEGEQGAFGYRDE
jgi:hypothetical protein